MPLYEYKCPTCGERALVERTVDDRNLPLICVNPLCCMENMKRVYSFSSRVFQGGYNASLGVHVESERALMDHAKRMSEEASARTGYEHNFQPVDVTDAAACGVQGAGLDATEKRATDSGQREAKLWL
jgi:putative FmdB family regulatory protein